MQNAAPPKNVKLVTETARDALFNTAQQGCLGPTREDRALLPDCGIWQEDDQGWGGVQKGWYGLDPHAHGDTRGVAWEDRDAGQEACLRPGQAHWWGAERDHQAPLPEAGRSARTWKFCPDPEQTAKLSHCSRRRSGVNILKGTDEYDLFVKISTILVSKCDTLCWHSY